MPSGRGLVIAGDGRYDRKRLMEAADAVGWPVLATALSGLRGEEVVGGYHHILKGVLDEDLVPEIVVAVGAIGPDLLLEDLIAMAPERIRVDAWGRTIDPRANATASLRGDVVDLLREVRPPDTPDWRESWLSADRQAWNSVDERLSSVDRPTGGAVAATVNRLDWNALVVASSLPIREVDAHLRRTGGVFANRGASGIDGFVSTALGVASVIPRTLALAGDLSLLHDANGFLNDHRHDLTLIVIDNEGGGLFDTLPQARHAPHYERLFVTPPGRDLADLARFHDTRVTEVGSVEDLEESVGQSLDRGGLEVVIVPVDRSYDAEVRG